MAQAAPPLAARHLNDAVGSFATPGQLLTMHPYSESPLSAEIGLADATQLSDSAHDLLPVPMNVAASAE